MDRRFRSGVIVPLLMRKPRLQVFSKPANAFSFEPLKPQKPFKIYSIKNNAVQAANPSLDSEIMTDDSMLTPT